MFKYLGKTLFSITVLVMTLNISAMEDNENRSLLKYDLLDFPQLEGIESISQYGGSYWMGYYGYQMNWEEKVLHAWWDQRDFDDIRREKGSESLDEQDLENLLGALGSLTDVNDHSDCAIAADGEEEMLYLTYEDRQIKIVSMRSKIFVCGDVYVTNKSFDTVKDVLNKILPNPF